MRAVRRARTAGEAGEDETPRPPVRWRARGFGLRFPWYAVGAYSAFAAMRRLRAFAAMPAKPVPSKTSVAGSGTAAACGSP